MQRLLDVCQFKEDVLRAPVLAAQLTVLQAIHDFGATTRDNILLFCWVSLTLAHYGPEQPIRTPFGVIDRTFSHLFSEISAAIRVAGCGVSCAAYWLYGGGLWRAGIEAQRMLRASVTWGLACVQMDLYIAHFIILVKLCWPLYLFRVFEGHFVDPLRVAYADLKFGVWYLLQVGLLGCELLVDHAYWVRGEFMREWRAACRIGVAINDAAQCGALALHLFQLYGVPFTLLEIHTFINMAPKYALLAGHRAWVTFPKEAQLGVHWALDLVAEYADLARAHLTFMWLHVLFEAVWFITGYPAHVALWVHAGLVGVGRTMQWVVGTVV